MCWEEPGVGCVPGPGAECWPPRKGREEPSYKRLVPHQGLIKYTNTLKAEWVRFPFTPGRWGIGPTTSSQISLGEEQSFYSGLAMFLQFLDGFKINTNNKNKFCYRIYDSNYIKLNIYFPTNAYFPALLVQESFSVIITNVEEKLFGTSNSSLNQ